MTVRANWMQTLTELSVLLVMSDSAYARTVIMIDPPIKSSISKLRSDKMVVDARTGFCITGYVSESTIAHVRLSGEELPTVGALENSTATSIDFALESLGFPATSPPRAFWNISNERPDRCTRWTTNILVSFKIEPLPGTAGYRVSMSATQGRRTYLVRIDRPVMIEMYMEFRNGIKFESEYDWDGKPFWDVRHDTHKLNVMLVEHLFKDK